MCDANSEFDFDCMTAVLLEAEEAARYCSAVRELLRLASCTRPCTGVVVLGKYVAVATLGNRHKAAMQNVLQHLKGTAHFGLSFFGHNDIVD
jgi:hypothetical protein